MLWVDKHRPLTLEKMDYLKDQATQLGRLAASGDLPHLLFYGPSGAGKKTRVMALLRAMFGSGVEKVGGASILEGGFTLYITRTEQWHTLFPFLAVTPHPPPSPHLFFCFGRPR